jgi:hypothetical protein
MKAITNLPFSPKISTSPSCILSAKPGYFCVIADKPHDKKGHTDKGTYVVERAISSNVTSLIKVSHFAHNSCNATRTQSRRTSPNELGECTEELAFSERCFDRKKVRKDSDDHQKFVCGIAAKPRRSLER